MAFFDARNHCQFIGRLGKEAHSIAEDRYAFSVAIRDPKDANKDPTWLDCYVSGPSAKYMQEFTKKGDLVLVSARYIQWKSKKDDTYRHGFDVISVNKIAPAAGDRQETQQEQAAPPAPPRQAAPAPAKTRDKRAEENDYDIPF